MAQQDPRHIVTGEARLSYVHLTQPRRNQQNPSEEPKYSVTVLIPKADTVTKQRIDAAFAAAVQAGIAGKWGGQSPARPANPIWDGDGLRSTGEPFNPECKGHWVITASNTRRAKVVDLNLQDIIDETQVYSGMYGNVSFDLFPYNYAGKKGIGVSLNSVRKTRDGEPLVSRANVEDDYGAAAAPWQQPAQPAYQQPYAPPQQPAVPPAPPQYAYPQNPYGAPAFQPGQQPVYPQQPAYAPQAPQQQPGYAPMQPQAPQPTYPQQPQIDPVTGLPVSGGVMGIG